MRRIFKETKIVSAWQTGNEEDSQKVKRDYTSASVQAAATEENGSHTAKESSLMMCKVRYGCNVSCARTSAMKNVQRYTRTSSYAITACRINRI
jgi:hypothetical protein